MYCPMQLDCKVMTGVIYNCPNVSECLRNSSLKRMDALQLYFLNLGAQPEDIQMGDGGDRNFCISPSPATRYSRAFAYNQDSQSRDRIIFGTTVNWSEQVGGLKHFSDLTIHQLEQLLDGGYINPNSCHNLSPTATAFLEFAREQARNSFEFTFEGYAIHPQREDYRVSIDGLAFRGTCPEPLISDFWEFAQNADELTLESNYLRAWWD